MCTTTHFDAFDEGQRGRQPRILLADALGLQVEQLPDGRLWFTCTRKELGRHGLDTLDPVEAVAALLRWPAVENVARLWDIPLAEAHVTHFDAAAAVYWLSGGDREWLHGSHYTVKWRAVRDELEQAYAPRLARALADCYTLGDVRAALLAEFSLLDFYERMLSRGMAKPLKKR
jgi:hypothetical protein